MDLKGKLYPTKGEFTYLRAYINSMPGGKTVGNWEEGEKEIVAITVQHYDPPEPLEAILQAYPPRKMNGAEYQYVAVVPKLVLDILYWYGGGNAWEAEEIRPILGLNLEETANAATALWVGSDGEPLGEIMATVAEAVEKTAKKRNVPERNLLEVVTTLWAEADEPDIGLVEKAADVLS